MLLTGQHDRSIRLKMFSNVGLFIMKTQPATQDPTQLYQEAIESNISITSTIKNKT